MQSYVQDHSKIQPGLELVLSVTLSYPPEKDIESSC